MKTYCRQEISRGDIYYADLRPVIGSEQGGIRPVLILQNNVGNRHSPTVIAAPITSKMGKPRLPKDQESILMQKNACHDFAEKKGWNIVGEEQEIGVSGYKVSTVDLVKLKRIRKAAEQGEFDILLVFMYDRLGRNLNETPFIAEWFTKKGIHVWSVYEGEIIDGVDAERMLDYIRFWQTDEAQKL